MTRPKNSEAIATRDTIANLWALAAAKGEARLRVPSRSAAFNVRNKLHAFRAELRRQAQAHTGFHASSYDKFKVLHREELDLNLAPTGYYLVSITTKDFIEFELLTGPTPPRDPVISAKEPCNGQESQEESEDPDESPWPDEVFGAEA